MDGGRAGSLLHELDRTVTPMGARLLRAWLLRPLRLARAHPRPARRRRGLRLPHDRARQVPRRAARAMHDLERLVARTALGTAGPRDLVALAHVARGRAPPAPAARRLPGAARREPRGRARRRGRRARRDRAHARRRAAGARARRRLRPRRRRPRARRPAAHLAGRASRSSRSSRSRSARAPASRSLKVRYNRVFGYYIEVSKSNLHAVPPDYHRKQTIAGGERFITPALKEYEEKVLGADERILEREIEMFEALRARGRRRGAAHPGHGARRRHARRAGRARRGRRAAQLRQAARPRRRRAARSSTAATRSSSATAPIRSCPTTPSSTARRASS